MGYDVHITRADDWSESETTPITLQDWLAYVGSDPEMRLDGSASATVPSGETLTYASEGLAVWTAYSQHEQGGNMAWFDHRGGEIVVKNPDPEILDKMRSIARTLRARVQGDEGEAY